MACALFDNIKAQQSANCDRAAVMAMREVKQYGNNPERLGAAIKNARAMSGKRVAAK